LPLLEVGGRAITQSNTINRYVGRLANLYPSDPWQAAQCDEVMDAVEDIGTQISATISIKEGPEKKVARERLATGPIPLYLTQLQEMLEQRGGEYFVERRLTVADLKIFVWVRHLRSGHLDHIPKDLPDRVAPALVRHLERVNNVPAIVAYYDKRRAAART
jgi:glutathione S-transferase